MAYDEQDPGEFAANVLAHALIYATLVLAVRLVEGGEGVPSHLIGAFRMGALLATPGSLLVGGALALPLYGDPRSAVRRALVLVAGALVFLLQTAFLTGLGGGAALWTSGYVVLSSLLLRPLAARLAAREATRAARIADLVALAALACVTLATLVEASGPTWQGVAGPLARMMGFSDPGLEALPPPAEGGPTPSGPPEGVPPDVMAKVQGLLGVEDPTPIVDPHYPYCRAEPEAGAARHPRALLLLLLDDVGTRELELRLEEGPLMPELARMAADGVRFEGFRASSDVGSDALVAAMTGIPPSLHPSLTRVVPMPRVDGVAGDLAARGFRTAFAYGTDPSVDFLRPFLDAVGFQTVLEPSVEGAPFTSGWGQPDGRTLTRLRTWIETRRSEDEDAPYFAVLQALSARAPHSLPDDVRLPADADAWERHLAAVRYLDGELGRFYAWFREHEAPRGAVLVVAGANHASLAAPGDPPPSVPGTFEPRFEVPLVVVGLPEDERDLARLHAPRPGSHVDLPQTLLGLVGVDKRGCYQGRDLLAEASDDWPLDRLVASVGGPRRDRLYFQHGTDRWMFGPGDVAPTLFDLQNDPTLRRNLYAEDDPDLAVVRDLDGAYRAIDNYLLREDGYRPPGPPRTFTPVAAAEHSLLVADGGHFRSAQGEEPPPNSVPAIQAAIEAGFPWIEAEVQVTQDGVPVVARRNVLELDGLNLPPALAAQAGRAALPFSGVTLAQMRQLRLPFESLEETLARVRGKAGLILTLDPGPWTPQRVREVRALLAVLAERPPRTEVIVRSSDLSVLETVHALAEVPVAFTTGGRAVDPRLLDDLAARGVSVVDLSTPILSRGLIEDAHARGLRVMAPAASVAYSDLASDFVIGPNLNPPRSP